MQNLENEQSGQSAQSTGKKFDSITYEGLDKLMDLFYGKVRKDENLGPIFNGAIGTDEESWSAHKKKIASFWAGMFLGDSSYHGAPLKAHFDLPPFPREFFSIWLNLFSESCAKIFELAPAQMLLDRAQSIANRFQTMLYDMPH